MERQRLNPFAGWPRLLAIVLLASACGGEPGEVEGADFAEDVLSADATGEAALVTGVISAAAGQVRHRASAESAPPELGRGRHGSAGRIDGDSSPDPIPARKTRVRTDPDCRRMRNPEFRERCYAARARR